MNGPAQIIAEFLWKQSWQIALLFPVVWLACRLLRNASAHWRYLLWLLVLVKCFVPATFEFSAPVVSQAVEKAFDRGSRTKAATFETSTALVSGSAVTSTHQNTVLSRSSSWNWATVRNWVILVWGVTAGVYLLVAILKAVVLQQKLKRGRTWPDMDLECEFVELVQTLAIKSRPKLCLIRGISQPFVWGIARGCIYLPEGFGSQGTREQRRVIMAHELAHVLRWDALVNFVQLLAQAIFIFHPLVWWMNRNVRHEREKCCDEIAIATLGVDSREYGNTIVERLVTHFEPSIPSSALAISGHAKDLEDRIKSILVPGRTFYRRPTFIVTVTILAAFCLAVPMGLAVLPQKLQKAITSLTAPHAIDLSAHINADIRQNWTSEYDLSALAAGEQTLGGIPFRIFGAVQLGSDKTKQFPAEIKNIVVDAPVKQLHLLHATLGLEKESATVAKLVLHYDDGKTAELLLNYGEHLRDCWFSDFEATSSKSTAMAWTTPETGAKGGSLRLYRTTLENPQPTTTITHIDYVSTLTQSAPFMVALTID